MDLDSHGVVNLECQSSSEDKALLARASDWKSVLSCIAPMSRLLDFSDGVLVDGPKCFDDIGMNCIMHFNTWGTCPRVRTPQCSLETVAQTLPTRQECLVPDVPSGAVAQLCGCAWLHGYRVFPGREWLRRGLGLYKAGD